MSDTLTMGRSGELGAVGPAFLKRDHYGFSPSMVSALSPSSPQAEAICGLRNHVMARHIGLGRRALAVCAPSAGVGCSFVAANLAVALSQIGVKTLLIDGDLRHATVERMIRAPHAVTGLSHCLTASDTPFGASIDADVLPNFSVMFAGQSKQSPQELLAGERFNQMMNFCLREYDATIVDTPPANTSSDARRISGAVGYALVVTGRDKTMVKDVSVLIDQLKSDYALVIGTLLNRA